MSFTVSLCITRKENICRNVGVFTYGVYRASIANLDMFVFIDSRRKIEVGDRIVSERCFLTNYDRVPDVKELALRIEDVSIVEQRLFHRMQHLEICLNGMLIRSQKTEVKTVGAGAIPLVVSTLCLKNEENKKFMLLILGFRKLADILNELPSNSYVNVKGRLLRQRIQEGFELNLSNIQLVNKNIKKERRRLKHGENQKFLL